MDDDTELCELMADFFAQHKMQLTFAHDGRRGLALALEKTFDLVILDVMLPILNGFQILEQIRRRSAVPVIMLTARIEQRDRIAGLNAGADDYLPKPFGPDELLARIRAVLRRAGAMKAESAQVSAGDFKLDARTRQVWQGEREIELTSIEFDLMDHLARSAGRVVSRDELTAALYQRPATPFERTLDVHISHLRRKLESEGRSCIRAIRGVGYLFSPESGQKK